MAEADLTVIGGGIVGLATAMALTEQTALSVVVLEAEDRLAAHQTGHNSGVIHSGLYYKPGSAKARTCAEGRELLYKFCQEEGIAHERCGKVVVATQDSEVLALQELQRRGEANGLRGLTWLDRDGLLAHEPHVRGVAGLFVAETGIVDYKEVTEAYARRVRARGGKIVINARVQAVRRVGTELAISTSAGEFSTRHLVNCAGLQADRVARLCGTDPGLQIIPFRGEYYTLTRDAWPLVRNLIYPVPDPRFPFLGVHFTRMIHGGVEAGPNAVLALRREGYRLRDVSLRDVLSMACYPGLWWMALKYWRTGFHEVARSLSKRLFWKSLRRLVPDLELKQLSPGGSGVRAQAVLPGGALVDDFRIVHSERAIHVLNAPSPAATASIAIGRGIAQMARTAFEIPPAGQVRSA